MAWRVPVFLALLLRFPLSLFFLGMVKILVRGSGSVREREARRASRRASHTPLAQLGADISGTKVGGERLTSWYTPRTHNRLHDPAQAKGMHVDTHSSHDTVFMWAIHKPLLRELVDPTPSALTLPIANLNSHLSTLRSLNLDASLSSRCWTSLARRSESS